MTNQTTRCIFRLRCPDAQQVFVVGTFNNWSTTAHPMESAGHDRWEAAVDLPPGRYPYCYFVIDKGWLRGTSAVRLSPTSLVNEGSVLDVPGENGDGGRPASRPRPHVPDSSATTWN